MPSSVFRTVLELAPDARFSRHSEGDFLRLQDGGILFAYTRFFDDQQDNAPSAIVATVSHDEGETWDEPREIIRADTFGVKNVMSVSLLRMQNGEIGLFYIVKERWFVHIMLSHSADEGKTFSRHIECTLPDRPGWFVLNNSRAERLASGRLLLPLAYHRTGMDPRTGKTFFDSCACSCMLYSDDDGESWQEAPEVIHPPFTGSASGLQEPGVIQLKNGDVWAYFRTDRMAQYEAISRDEGLHWTVPQPSRFSSPLSPMKIIRNPATQALYAFWNPIPNFPGRSQTCEGAWLGGRTPFVYATSADDGVTWSDETVIESDPRHGYCYPAVFFTRDGHMLAAYCAGGVADRSCLARLKMIKLPQ